MSGFGGAGGIAIVREVRRAGEKLISGAETPRGARCIGEGSGIVTHGFIQCGVVIGSPCGVVGTLGGKCTKVFWLGSRFCV